MRIGRNIPAAHRYRAVCAVALGLSLLCRCGEEHEGFAAWITVDNRSAAYTVRGVYTMRASQWSGWGINHLTTDVPPGTRGFVALEPDTWHIRIESDHPHAPYDLMNLAVHDGMEVYVEVTDASIDAYWPQTALLAAAP